MERKTKVIKILCVTSATVKVCIFLGTGTSLLTRLVAILRMLDQALLLKHRHEKQPVIRVSVHCINIRHSP